LRLTDLRLGKQVFDLRFWRKGNQTRYEVMKGDPAVVEQRNLAAVVHPGSA